MTLSSRSRNGELHLLFVRHGETQDNIDRILQGYRDTSLTPKGHEEAKFLAEKLRDQKIDVIYHSPLIRIVQTIEPLLSSRSYVQTYVDADLMGQGLGELEGGSYDQVDMSNPKSADGQPGVELFDDFMRRLTNAFARIVGVEAPQVEDRDRIVLVATHGVAITALFKTLEGSPSGSSLGPGFATRGSNAFEVRWTDSDDVAKLIVQQPSHLPIVDRVLDWSAISGKPFVIDYWGKEEKAIRM